MKNYLFLISMVSLLFFHQNVVGQNLVPNPSFEDTLGCPTMGGQIYRAAGWINFGITPDYFNACNTSLISTPQNGWGNQVPIEGYAYAGLACNISTISNIREFIGCQLIQSLVIGETYYVSFYVSLSDIPSGDCAINKIGIKFSTVAYDSINHPPLNNFAHVVINSIVSDTTNWTKISGSFVADSTYNYVMLGNFFDDSHLDTLNCPTNAGTYSYYFFDLICVSPDPEFCDLDPLTIGEINKPEKKIQIYPNPATDITHIHSKDRIKMISVYSGQGILLFSKDVSDQRDVDILLAKIPCGLYIVQVYSNKEICNLKLQINQN